MKYLFSKILKSSLVLLSLVSFSLYGEPAHWSAPFQREGAECTDLECHPTSDHPPHTRATPLPTPPVDEISSRIDKIRHQLEAISPADELPDRLPILFYSVEKDGKRHYMFGTAHIPIPLSRLYCQAWIERELQASDQVFLEGKLTQFKKYVEDEFSFIIQSVESSFNQQIEWLSWLNKLEFMKQLIIENFSLRMDTQIEELSRSASIPILNLDEGDRPIEFISDRNKSKLHRLIVFAKTHSIEEVSKKLALPPQHISVNKYLESLMAFFSDPQLSSFGKEQVKLVFEDRNKLWFEKIKTAHEDPEIEHLFIAVGGGHFIGPYNLIDMLTEEGFSIFRIDCGIDELLSSMNEDRGSEDLSTQ